MTRWLRHAVPLWSGALALLLCAPLLAPGFALTYDMVWVPRLDAVRADVWGLGSALPRAVPSDAFIALLDNILPGLILHKAILLGTIFGAGLAMGRLLDSAPLPVRLAAISLYVWNPFVAERLVLGHWPLLIAYAAVPWLIASVRSEDGPRRPATLLALAATALTPATGLMGALLAFTAKQRGNNAILAFSVAAVNAPWVVAGLLHVTIARSDGAAVALFDVQPEGRLGRVAAALSLGGIWNVEVVPESRGQLVGVVLAGVIWFVILIGLVDLWTKDRRLLLGLGLAGAIGVVIALSGWLAQDLLASVVREVPAAGLLRDGTRYLLLLAPLEAVAFGFGAHRLSGFIGQVQIGRYVAVLALLVPLAALPDMAWGVGGKIKTADYPQDWYDAREVIAASAVPGDILVLPFSSYRKPAWSHGQSVLDPAGRFFDRETVVSDVLLVSGKPIAGEDPRAAEMARILRTKSPAEALARAGIGIVVVETDAVPIRASTFTGMKRIHAGAQMSVYSIAKAKPRAPQDGDIFAMTAAWLLAFLALWSGATRSILEWLKR